MLICKVVEDVVDTPRLLFKRLLRKSDGVSRDSTIIGDKRFDILSLPYVAFSSPEVLKLFALNRGRVLESVDSRQNERLKEYLFDKSPYYKRGLLSSLVKLIKSSGEQLSVVVYDNSFTLCGEYVSLAENVKSFVLVAPLNAHSDAFAKRVYYEYGLKIVIREDVRGLDFDLHVDFSGINIDGSLYVDFMGSRMVVYPDSIYFEPDAAVLELIEQGVPIKCACAAIHDNYYMA